MHTTFFSEILKEDNLCNLRSNSTLQVDIPCVSCFPWLEILDSIQISLVSNKTLSIRIL